MHVNHFGAHISVSLTLAVHIEVVQDTIVRLPCNGIYFLIVIVFKVLTVILRSLLKASREVPNSV